MKKLAASIKYCVHILVYLYSNFHCHIYRMPFPVTIYTLTQQFTYLYLFAWVFFGILLSCLWGFLCFEI